jgi:hypothetical protein
MRATQRFGALVRGFGMFWWDFIVGEDLTIALGVCIGLAGVYVLHVEKVSAWWILPVLWITALVTSLARAVRKAS